MRVRRGDPFKKAKARDLRSFVQIEQRSDHGEYVSGLCPFHDDGRPGGSPSLMVYKDGFRCLSNRCGAHGSIIDWVAHQRGIVPTKSQLCKIAEELASGSVDRKVMMVIPPAAKIKARPVPLKTLEQYEGLEDTEFIKYMESSTRLINRHVCESLGITWSPGTVVIPIWRGVPWESEVVSLRYRHLKGDIKYSGVPGQNTKTLYNRWVMYLDCPGPLYVTYGEFDSIMGLQLGLKCVSPTNGCESFDPEWIDAVSVSDVVFIPDKGEEVQACRDAQEFGFRAEVLPLPVGKDLTEMVVALIRKSEFHSAVSTALLRLDLTTLRSLVQEMYKRLGIPLSAFDNTAPIIYAKLCRMSMERWRPSYDKRLEVL